MLLCPCPLYGAIVCLRSQRLQRGGIGRVLMFSSSVCHLKLKQRRLFLQPPGLGPVDPRPDLLNPGASQAAVLIGSRRVSQAAVAGHAIGFGVEAARPHRGRGSDDELDPPLRLRSW